MISRYLGTMILMAAMLAPLSGCVMRRNPGPDVLAPEPTVPDQAMQQRQWEVSRAMYANTGVIAAPTGFTFRPDADQPVYTFAASEPGTFLLNVLLIPYQAVVHPAWTRLEYRASTVPPSSSAMPPLPPSSQGEMPQSEPPTVSEPVAPVEPGKETVLPPSPGAQPSDRPISQPASALSEPAAAPTTQPIRRSTPDE